MWQDNQKSLAQPGEWLAHVKKSLEQAWGSGQRTWASHPRTTRAADEGSRVTCGVESPGQVQANHTGGLAHSILKTSL